MFWESVFYTIAMLIVLNVWLSQVFFVPGWVRVILKLTAIFAGFFIVCFLAFGSLAAFLCLQTILFTGLFVFAAPRPLINRERRIAPYRITVNGMVLLLWIVNTAQEFNTIRTDADNHPYESIANRLPSRTAASSPVQFNPQSLAELEHSIDSRFSGLRTEYLRLIHEDCLQAFIKSPGFGRQRGPSGRDLVGNPIGDHAPSVYPQPASSEPSKSDNVIDWTKYRLDPDLETMNRKGVANFADSFGFGFIKSRNEVAGFQSHHLNTAPEATKLWKVRTVDLVGLLLHNRPVVYVSDQLPSMEDVAKKPTRELDPFESRAIEELKAGADISTSPEGSELRMLGAVRNVMQCLRCHDGLRGDLLGAFTYHLQPVAK